MNLRNSSLKLVKFPKIFDILLISQRRKLKTDDWRALFPTHATSLTITFRQFIPDSKRRNHKPNRKERKLSDYFRLRLPCKRFCLWQWIKVFCIFILDFNAPYNHDYDAAVNQAYHRQSEGLTLETSAFQSLYGGQFTLSTPLINQIFVYHSPTDAAPQFLQKLIPFTHYDKQSPS